MGATLCDYAELPEGIKAGSSLKIGKVDRPILLIPFLAAIALSQNILFDIAWASGSAHLDGGSEALLKAAAALDAKQIPITLTAGFGNPQVASAGKVPSIPADVISALNTLAMRTTVPSSESSRAGAGSTTSDND